MSLELLLEQKIRNADCLRLIRRGLVPLGAAERALLDEIVRRFEFDPVEAQALAQAVVQQARFDPDALHEEDDEDGVSFCAHCLNPPPPPLRDYLMWRERRSGGAD